MTANRFYDAYMIQQGACNPAGIARALVTACDQAMADHQSTDRVRNDPAVRLIVHQLAFLTNSTEYDQQLGYGDDDPYRRDMRLCRERGDVPSS